MRCGGGVQVRPTHVKRCTSPDAHVTLAENAVALTLNTEGWLRTTSGSGSHPITEKIQFFWVFFVINTQLHIHRDPVFFQSQII